MEHEERLVELETKIAFLENYINEINTVVIEQDKLIKKLTSETEEIKRRLDAGKEPLPAGEKPPHY